MSILKQIQDFDAAHDFLGSRCDGINAKNLLLSQVLQNNPLNPEEKCYQAVIAEHPALDYRTLMNTENFSCFTFDRDTNDENVLKQDKLTNFSEFLTNIFGDKIKFVLDSTPSYEWKNILNDNIKLVELISSRWDEATKIRLPNICYDTTPNTDILMGDSTTNSIQILHDKIKFNDAEWSSSDLLGKKHVFSVANLCNFMKNALENPTAANVKLLLKTDHSKADTDRLQSAFQTTSSHSQVIIDNAKLAKFSGDSLQCLSLKSLNGIQSLNPKFVYVGLTGDRIAFLYALVQNVPYILNRVTQNEVQYIVFNPNPKSATTADGTRQDQELSKLSQFEKLKNYYYELLKTATRFQQNEWLGVLDITRHITNTNLNINTKINLLEKYIPLLQNIGGKNITEVYSSINATLKTELIVFKDPVMKNDFVDYAHKWVDADMFIDLYFTKKGENRPLPTLKRSRNDEPLKQQVFTKPNIKYSKRGFEFGEYISLALSPKVTRERTYRNNPPPTYREENVAVLETLENILMQLNKFCSQLLKEKNFPKMSHLSIKAKNIVRESLQESNLQRQKLTPDEKEKLTIIIEARRKTLSASTQCTNFPNLFSLIGGNTDGIEIHLAVAEGLVAIFKGEYEATYPDPSTGSPPSSGPSSPPFIAGGTQTITTITKRRAADFSPVTLTLARPVQPAMQLLSERNCYQDVSPLLHELYNAYLSDMQILDEVSKLEFLSISLKDLYVAMKSNLNEVPHDPKELEGEPLKVDNMERWFMDELSDGIPSLIASYLYCYLELLDRLDSGSSGQGGGGSSLQTYYQRYYPLYALRYHK